MQISQRYTDLSEKLKAIAHPVRLCIVIGIMEKECNVRGMQDCLKIPQSTISQHLSKLKAAGVVEGERCGLEITYRVIDEDIKDIINAIRL